MNVHNFSFLGWPDGDQVVTIAVDSSASITWIKSWNITISSFIFNFYGNFIFIMRFEHSELVQLSNISIYGNGYNGCSSIISEESVLEFNDSMFIGLNGFVGAALMMFTSNITFRGSIMFTDNTAVSGGSIYLTHNSTIIFNGTSLFLNKNLAYWGGALSISKGNFIIKGYALFDSNYADFLGGALRITSRANFIFCGSVYSESSNVSLDVDVLSLKKAKVFDTECSTDNTTSFNNSITFLRNTAEYQGGSIACGNESTNTIVSTVTFIGIMYFIESYQSAINGYGCNMRFIGTTYFYKNSALYEGGGAIVSSNSNIMLSGTAYFE